MRRYYFKNYEELSDYMIDKAQNGFYAVAVLFYEDALRLLRELMFNNDIDVGALDIKPEQYEGYNKEYYVSIADDMVVSVEPAYVGNRYLDTEADITLIDGSASSTIIKNLPVTKCCEIKIGDIDDCDFVEDYDNKDDELDELLENAELLKDKSNKVIGIQIDAKSFFKYLFG